MRKLKLNRAPNASRTSDYPVRDEARLLVAALYEKVLLVHGARAMADEDLKLAEEGTAAGYDSLPASVTPVQVYSTLVLMKDDEILAIVPQHVWCGRRLIRRMLGLTISLLLVRRKAHG